MQRPRSLLYTGYSALHTRPIRCRIGEPLARLRTADVYAFPVEREGDAAPTPITAAGAR